MIGFETPSWAWLFLLVPPLVLLYFLKLKRQRVLIPSLFLWRQVLNDNRVNSPFQRFKRHLLLLLQLLILCLLILAALRPFFMGSAEDSERVPIIVDASASMGARDANGASRLEAAKEKIRQLIVNKTAEQRFAIISASDTARKHCGFSDNAKVLLDALAGVEVQDVPSDIEDAMRMTQALARNQPFEEALFFSDGNFPKKTNFNLSFKLNFQRLEPAAPNVGVTQLNARRDGDDGWSVYVMIEGTEKASRSTVEVYRDGELAGTEIYDPALNLKERMAFPVKGNRPGRVSVKLVPDGVDSLSSDNEAFLDLPTPRKLSVAASSSLPACRSALAGVSGISLHKLGETESTVDLLLTDKLYDETPTPGVLVEFGFVPEALKPLLEIKKSGDEVVDWDRANPLLQHVELSELTILDQPAFKTGKTQSDLENLGYETIIHGREGPLALQRQTANGLEYVFLFKPAQSTLPYRIGFPILMANLVDVATRRVGLADVNATPAGVLPDLNLTPSTTYTIRSPNAERLTLKSNVNGVLAAVPAKKTGLHEILNGSQTVETIGVSLLSERETLLESRDSVEFNELSVKAENAPAQTPRALWKHLALAAFAILLLEWWYYQKPPAALART